MLSLAVWKTLLEKECKISSHACDSCKYFPLIHHMHTNPCPVDPQVCENVTHVNRYNKHLGTEESVQVRSTSLWRRVPLTHSSHVRYNWQSKRAHMQHLWTPGWTQPLWPLSQRNLCCPGGAFILLSGIGVHKWGYCYCHRKGFQLLDLTIEACPFKSRGSRFSSHRRSTQSDCQSNPGLRDRDLLEITL